MASSAFAPLPTPPNSQANASTRSWALKGGMVSPTRVRRQARTGELSMVALYVSQHRPSGYRGAPTDVLLRWVSAWVACCSHKYVGNIRTDRRLDTETLSNMNEKD